MTDGYPENGNGHNRNLESLIREYETRYGPKSPADAEARVDEPKAKGRPKMKRQPNAARLDFGYVSDEERKWASIAHASVWLTLLGGLLSLGTIVPVTVFVPLGIYLYYRQRSPFVAYHALQSFAIQLIGTVGALLLGVVGGLVWGIGLAIAILSMLVLVGFVVVPLWGLVGIALFFAVVLMPVLMLFFGTIGAVETRRGRDYRYPFIGRWLDRFFAPWVTTV